MIEYSAQIADRTKLFRSRIREIVGGRTETLEALAVEMYWRGLSIRDIELLFADEAKALLSRTALIRGAASEIAEFESRQPRQFATNSAPALPLTRQQPPCQPPHPREIPQIGLQILVQRFNSASVLHIGGFGLKCRTYMV